LAIFLLFTVTAVKAESLGVIGPTYKIQEEDLMVVMQRLGKEYESSGQMERDHQAAIEQVRKTIENPPALEGITNTETPRSFFYDPTYVVPKNIVDHKGNVIYPAGYTFNPLDIRPLTKQWLFFDARDERQVDYAKKLFAQKGEFKIMLILTAGSYMEFMRKTKMIVYYDQYGVMTKKLGVTHVPSLVSQEGRRIRIDEIKL
jgi:conjugal transfer pilus assembly protein TraW